MTDYREDFWPMLAREIGENPAISIRVAVEIAATTQLTNAQRSQYGTFWLEEIQKLYTLARKGR